MFPYSNSVTPAARTHMDAQTSFLNAVSKSIFGSFQQLSNLNLQLAQTLLEEATIASQQLLTANQHTDVTDAAASRAQPASQKLRAYQQHLSRLTADAQVDLSRVAEEHVQKTALTAKALAEEVARTAVEDTKRNIQEQEETTRQFNDPFIKSGIKHGSGSAARGSASMQSSSTDNAQGGSTGGSHSSGKPA